MKLTKKLAVAWVCFLLLQSAAWAAEPDLIGHWKLTSDAKDSSSHSHSKSSHDVDVSSEGGRIDERSSQVVSNQQAADPIHIGSRRELFVDRFLIDELIGARLKLHHPRPREVAIRFDQPWEGNTSGYPTVMSDSGVFKMIYRAHRMIWDDGKLQMARSPVVCYAESKDGIQWTRPNLRIHLVRGQVAKQVKDPLNNNIVWPGSAFSGSFVPFLDDRPGCPPREKFKAVSGDRNVGLHLFTSPDAIHWTKRDEPLFQRGALDSMNVMFWEPRMKKYVVYYRTVVDGRRSIAMTSSSDLIEWSESVPLEYPGSPPQQMYTNGIHPYHRAPHLSFGFPARYTARKMTNQIQSLEPVQLRAELTAAYARVGSDLTDSLFMSSRDGIRFYRWDDAFKRPGPEAGPAATNWMYGDNYQNYGLFETASDRAGAPPELSMLFREGYWRTASSQLRRYTIRLDGFVSVRAPYAGGELLTKPFRFAGHELVLNYATSAAGRLRVEIQDLERKAVPGYSLDECIELIGDSVEHTVRWKNGPNVSSLAGTPVRLRFAMKDADIYSLQFIPKD